MKSLLDAKDVVPMTQELSAMFLRMVMADRIPVLFDEDSAKEHPILQIMYHRLALQEVEVSLPVAAFCGYLSNGNPGKAVMWAYTLNRMYDKQRSMITIADLANTFPVGFPTEEELKSIWNDQKQDPNTAKGTKIALSIDNKLDWLEPWILT